MKVLKKIKINIQRDMRAFKKVVEIMQKFLIRW